MYIYYQKNTTKFNSNYHKLLFKVNLNKIKEFKFKKIMYLLIINIVYENIFSNFDYITKWIQMKL